MAKKITHKTLYTSSANAVKRLSVINPWTLRKKGAKTKAMIALIMISFFWGTTWLASKTGVKGMPALQMSAIRQVLAGLCFVIYFITKGMPFPRRQQWQPILILSFLNFFVSNALATWGMEYISSGLAAIIGAMFPLWLVIIALMREGFRKLGSKALLGFFLGFLGICIIFYDHLHDFLHPGFRFGILVSVIASLSWAFAALYTKKKAVEFNPYFSVGLQMIISGTALYIVSHLTHHAIPVHQIPLESWLSIAYLVSIGSVVSFIAYLYALQNLPTTQVAIYAYINPIIAVLLGAWAFGEQLNWYIGIGGLVTLLGVYLVNEAFRKKQ